MSDQSAAGTVAKKRRAPQGPRKPSPLYLFIKVDTAAAVGSQVTLAASYRDPRKMAERYTQSQANGEQLLVVTPE